MPLHSNVARAVVIAIVILRRHDEGKIVSLFLVITKPY